MEIPTLVATDASGVNEFVETQADDCVEAPAGEGAAGPDDSQVVMSQELDGLMARAIEPLTLAGATAIDAPLGDEDDVSEHDELETLDSGDDDDEFVDVIAHEDELRECPASQAAQPTTALDISSDISPMGTPLSAASGASGAEDPEAVEPQELDGLMARAIESPTLAGAIAIDAPLGDEDNVSEPDELGTPEVGDEDEFADAVTQEEEMTGPVAQAPPALLDLGREFLPIWTVAEVPEPPLSDSDVIPVKRGLLRDVLKDGTCPLHLRVRLVQALNGSAWEHPGQGAQDASSSSAATKESYPLVDSGRRLGVEELGSRCLTAVASLLSLPELLALRGTCGDGLMWAMQRAGAEHSELTKVHNRIRTRLWIQRVADVTTDTADETIFENQLKSFANDALRRRMEQEMADAKVHMERQIHAFQGEVDRRMEEQTLRVHAIVEERVQQQLDAILAAEMEKVRTLVEERVQERVRAIVQREVRAAVCEVHVRLSALARENDRLRDAFAEFSDLCFRSLAWGLSPNATGFFARTLRLMWCCHRRFSTLQAWFRWKTPDHRQQNLRARLESFRRGHRPDSPNMGEIQEASAPDVDEARRLLLLKSKLAGSGDRSPNHTIATVTPFVASVAAAALARASLGEDFSPSGPTSAPNIVSSGGQTCTTVAQELPQLAEATVSQAAAPEALNDTQGGNASHDVAMPHEDECPDNATPQQAVEADAAPPAPATVASSSSAVSGSCTEPCGRDAPPDGDDQDDESSDDVSSSQPRRLLGLAEPPEVSDEDDSDVEVMALLETEHAHECSEEAQHTP